MPQSKIVKKPGPVPDKGGPVNIHPVLLPPSMLPSDGKAVQMAPPMAEEFLISRFVGPTAPLACDIVFDPPSKVTKFTPEPLKEKLVTVVLADVVTVVGATKLTKALNVLAPVIVKSPTPD